MWLLLIVLISYLVVAYHSFAILRLTVHEDDLIERLQLCVIIPLLQLSFRQAVAILLEAQLFILRVPGYLHFQIEEMTILILQHHIQDRPLSEKGFRQQLRIQHPRPLYLQLVDLLDDPASQHRRACVLTDQHVLEKNIIVEGDRIFPILHFRHLQFPPLSLYISIRRKLAKLLNFFDFF